MDSVQAPDRAGSPLHSPCIRQDSHTLAVGSQRIPVSAQPGCIIGWIMVRNARSPASVCWAHPLLQRPSEPSCVQASPRASTVVHACITRVSPAVCSSGPAWGRPCICAAEVESWVCTQRPGLAHLLSSHSGSSSSGCLGTILYVTSAIVAPLSLNPLKTLSGFGTRCKLPPTARGKHAVQRTCRAFASACCCCTPAAAAAAVLAASCAVTSRHTVTFASAPPVAMRLSACPPTCMAHTYTTEASWTVPQGQLREAQASQGA